MNMSTKKKNSQPSGWRASSISNGVKIRTITWQPPDFSMKLPQFYTYCIMGVHPAEAVLYEESKQFRTHDKYENYKADDPSHFFECDLTSTTL